MARVYEPMPGKLSWCLNRCEEILVINAYGEITRCVVPTDLWRWENDFLTNFYQRGVGLLDYHLNDINQIRKRKRLCLLRLQETDLTEYGRETNKAVVAARRRALRDDIGEMAPDERTRFVEHAKVIASEQPPPHHTFAEYKAKRAKQVEESHLSRAEVERRLAAVKREPILVKPSKIDRIVKMLSITENPELIGHIVEKLDASEALELAEKLEQPHLRDALIRHSLAGI